MSFLSNELGFISQEMIFFIVTTVETSYLIHYTETYVLTSVNFV
jgi:hypothetical protein